MDPVPSAIIGGGVFAGSALRPADPRTLGIGDLQFTRATKTQYVNTVIVV